MNKIWLLGAAACIALSLGSCKPKQSAYKAAYEQAKEKETTAPVEEVVEEVEVADEPAPVSKPRYSNAATRSERINVLESVDIEQGHHHFAFPGSFYHTAYASFARAGCKNERGRRKQCG